MLYNVTKKKNELWEVKRNKATFDKFKKVMSANYPKAYTRYNNGQGYEFKHGRYSAKMSSVASSSRFCYLALRAGAKALCEDSNISANLKDNVVFEADCPIK